MASFSVQVFDLCAFYVFSIQCFTSHDLFDHADNVVPEVNEKNNVLAAPLRTACNAGK